MRKEEEKRGRSNGKEDRNPEPEKETKEEPEPGPEKEKEEVKSAEETQYQVRTPVRERIRKLNKKAAASPGKFPLMKQQMLDTYFKKKSPKASKAREKIEPEPESNKEQKFMGARNSPLMGEPSQLGSTKLPSKDPRPESEECGRTWSLETRKKALKALEKWPPDTGPSSESPKRGKPRKRLQRVAVGKEDREGSGGVIQRWLRIEKLGPEAPKTCLGPGGTN